MKFDTSSSILLSIATLAAYHPTAVVGGKSIHPIHLNGSRGDHRSLQTTTCLASTNFTTTFAHETCTPDQIELAISNAIVTAGSACDGASTTSELAILLETTEDETEIHAALQAKCNDAFSTATLPFKKITKKGDAFDREFFAGGSTWNDQYQTSIDGTTYHNLKYDASRIMYEVQANSASTRPIDFPSYLPQFDNCNMGAVMCCYVSDRQANDVEGECMDSTGNGDGCADADPVGNTDVCLANMEDAQVSNRVQSGLAVYHLNKEGKAAEGNVNCHGFAWDSGDEDSGSARYKGNMLFDVAFKQSLYDKGYAKNVPGAPMCGCMEQMPTVTRADCTKITSISETYTLSATVDNPTLVVTLTDSGVQYGPCDTDSNEDLASHYKDINANNSPTDIDSKLVGDGGCVAAIDSAVQAVGYKRSTLQVTESYFTPPDVNPARVIVKFNSAVSDAAASTSSFKIYDTANPTSELGITSASLEYGGSAVELTLSSIPATGITYQVSNLATLHKRIATMVTLEAGSSPTDIVNSSWDFIQLDNWRIGHTCETCSQSHLSISSDNMMTSQIFRDTGSLHPGPRSDYNGFNTGMTGATFSTNGIVFGDKAVQIRDWRVRQIDATHLSVTNKNGNVSRIYRSDGTVHGNINSFSGYNTELGGPTCAYATSKYLQIGEWRFAAYDDTHLSVSHRLGNTSMIHRTTGTTHRGPRRDFNAWIWPEGEAVMGSKDGCALLDPAEPNVLQIGENWKLAQMYDGFHFSVSSRQADGQSGNDAKTSMIYRGSDGGAIKGPRSDYNAWGEVPTYSDSPPRFGDKTLEVGSWRIRQVDDNHLTVTHISGSVARAYRKDGEVFSKLADQKYSGYAIAELGSPTCAFQSQKFIQVGDWRIAEFDETHLSVSHKDGQTSFIYKRDGTAHAGPRTDFGTWDVEIGSILQGSTDGCASFVSAILTPEDTISSSKVLAKFNRDLDPSTGPSLASSFKIYDTSDPASELAVASSSVGSDESILEITLASQPISGISYQITNIQDTTTSDPAEVVESGAVLDIAQASWDYIQIANWRIGRTCETCSQSHMSISSDNMLTSQIFRDTGSVHPGPRSDYNGFNTDMTGPTYSDVGVQFGHFAVQIRDWRVRQIDSDHLSVSNENNNVSRIYRSDGTVHGKVNSFSGYNTELGEPTCAYLTSNYLRIGDWRFGAMDDAHLSVTHKGGMTSMIYRTTGTTHKGPRTDFNAWNLPNEEVIMGSNTGCDSFTLFG